MRMSKERLIGLGLAATALFAGATACSNSAPSPKTSATSTAPECGDLTFQLTLEGDMQGPIAENVGANCASMHVWDNPGATVGMVSKDEKFTIECEQDTPKPEFQIEVQTPGSDDQITGMAYLSQASLEQQHTGTITFADGYYAIIPSCGLNLTQ